MIKVVLDDEEYLFETEQEAFNFYLNSKPQRYITVYDGNGKPSYGSEKSMTRERLLKDVVREMEAKGWNMSCSYGVHDMEYSTDEEGNITYSTCKLCGAQYYGFHF